MRIKRHLICSQYPNFWLDRILFLHMLLLYIKKGTTVLSHGSLAIPRPGVDQTHNMHAVVAVPSNPSPLGRHRTTNLD